MSNYHKSRIAFTVKLVLIVVLVLIGFNSFAMRCGTQLINEGDTYGELIATCGQPTSDTLSTVIYINKDGDGMNYYIHCDNSGAIDDIKFSRN